jgi:hypothetical protein
MAVNTKKRAAATTEAAPSNSPASVGGEVQTHDQFNTLLVANKQPIHDYIANMAIYKERIKQQKKTMTADEIANLEEYLQAIKDDEPIAVYIMRKLDIID